MDRNERSQLLGSKIKMTSRIVESRSIRSSSSRRSDDGRSSSSPTPDFVDGRPEAAVHEALQHTADGSPQVQRLTAMQALADGSSQVRAHQDRQGIADRRAPLQAKLGTGGGPARVDGDAGRRGALPEPVRAKMEGAFGVSFRDVTINTNSTKASARGALAVTQGSQIDFAPGQFRPEARAGQELLGHELTHVLQQRAGRVSQAQSKRSPLEQQLDVDHDDACEREADELGARAARGEPAHVRGAPPDPGPPQGGGPIQPKLGFELEMLILIDKAGRPVPEKTAVGKFGEHVNIDVDQGAEVAALTPALPETTGFDVVGDYAGRYHLTDPKSGTDYDYDTFNAAMADGALWDMLEARCLRPLVFKFIDVVKKVEADPGSYDEVKGNQDFGDLFEVIWLAVNHLQTAEHTRLLALHGGVDTDAGFVAAYKKAFAQLSNQNIGDTVTAVLQETVARLGQPGNAQLKRDFVQACFSTSFRKTVAPYDEVTAREASAEEPGMGGTRYASIVELVTEAYEPETGSGRAKIKQSLRDAVVLARAIAAANPRTTRTQLNTLSTNLTGVADSYFIGNPRSKRQTTDASIQSTFGIDLAQLASYVKSTMDPSIQDKFRSKHEADAGNLARTEMVYRAEKEIMAAVEDATAILNDADFVGAPDLPNLRGLLILVCQYLRLGKYCYNDDKWTLDKNMSALLSRTDLADIRKGMPALERTWLNSNKAALRTKVLARTGRVPTSTVLTNLAQTGVYPGIATTVGGFVDNVFEQDADGLTSEFGGFREIGLEQIRPKGSHLRSSPKLGPVFELRNLVPHIGANERFPSSRWVEIGMTIADVLYNLHRRTDAEAMTDIKVRSFGDKTEEATSWKT